ncbi:MAG: phosphate/phosphite/phosphonate ABC transporter substrate-binding protein [Pseudomonadales bacterium]|nr:phosphate/phosphite/phosphonate ABC transporter substrate-binding protein [Pseudomonadales bacterium]
MIKSKFRSIWPLCLILLLAACGGEQKNEPWQSSGTERKQNFSSGETTITLSDVDPDTPTDRMHKIRPLANFIAAGLGWDSSRVKVRIARSVEEISVLLEDGRVDIFVDSSYPNLLARRASNSEVILEALVNGERRYQAFILASSTGGMKILEDLIDHKIALQERYSTSGYLLPAAFLVEQKLPLTFMPVQDTRPPKGTIGFFFSGDEENTIAMIRNRKVAAGAVSSTDYEHLPNALKQEFVILAKTRHIPRKMATMRNGFDPELKLKIINILLSITDEDRRKMVSESGWNWEFITLDKESHAGMLAIDKMIDQISHLTSH